MTPLEILGAVIMAVIYLALFIAIVLAVIMVSNRHNLKYWPHIARKSYPPLKAVLKDGYKPKLTKRGWE